MNFGSCRFEVRPEQRRHAIDALDVLWTCVRKAMRFGSALKSPLIAGSLV